MNHAQAERQAAKEELQHLPEAQTIDVAEVYAMLDQLGDVADPPSTGVDREEPAQQRAVRPRPHLHQRETVRVFGEPLVLSEPAVVLLPRLVVRDRIRRYRAGAVATSLA
jgi:hypothetical protein